MKKMLFHIMIATIASVSSLEIQAHEKDSITAIADRGTDGGG